MLTHRYVGVVMGLLMLLWFASGIVMLFVHWPEVSDDERTKGLAPISWAQCCRFGETLDVQQVDHAMIEDLAGRPVLRFDGGVIDLATGQAIHRISSTEAAAVATTYARAHGIAGGPGAPEAVERDQWTVTGYFNKRRPFYLFHFDDPARTDVYVSAHTGAVSQVVNAREKVLNWLGPIPHWLYFEGLRADTKLWAQVVIWTSIVGIFLTVTGLYLGVVAWRPWRDARLTPFRGWMAWHHLTGLAAGVLTLTWVASGLVSMNPWGFLESAPDARPEQMSGFVSFGDVRQAAEAARAEGVVARRITIAPLSGTLYLMADGRRLDAAARSSPLTRNGLAMATTRLGAIDSQSLITKEDAYYFGHHESVRLPVWRVRMTDGVRFYLDPASGQVLARADAARRGFRWLFEAPHRMDFIPGFDRGGGWAAAVTALLLLASAGVATGVWLGWRRARSDLNRLTKKAPKLG